MTRPLSSIKTCTLTAPPALTALAAAGYAGFGRLVALPLSTPPETVFGTGGFAFGGGGGSSPPVGSVPPLVERPPVPPDSTTRALLGSTRAPVSESVLPITVKRSVRIA